MSSEYMILKVHTQPGIDGISGLEAAVNDLTNHGWIPAGGPFFDPSLSKWCQALHRTGKPAPAGEVELRETPPKTDTHFPMVHADPNDGPLRMRGDLGRVNPREG